MGDPILSGIKVVEFAHLIAGPFAGTFLADLGADVIHVEEPRIGDPARRMGPAKDGTHVWWKVAGRNKRSVTLDLRQPAGQELARELIAWADVVITNFRVETLEDWGLAWADAHRLNPKVVYLQVSAFGTDTSLRNAPGFGKVGEAMSGVVQITGFPDGPPVHTGFSHADSVTGLMGAFAVSAALTRRHRDDFDGEWIDLALFESLYRLIEWQVIAFDQLDMNPQRCGNQLPVSPASVVNMYSTADDVWITVTSATPRSVRNVAELLRLDLDDFATVEKQNENKALLNGLLREWFRTRTADEALDAMRECDVVGTRIYSVADIVEDPIYREREAIVTLDDPDLGPVRMQGVVPKLHKHPGAVRHTAPSLGGDNEAVYREILGRDSAELAQLRGAGVI